MKVVFSGYTVARVYFLAELQRFMAQHTAFTTRNVEPDVRVARLSCAFTG